MLSPWCPASFISGGCRLFHSARASRTTAQQAPLVAGCPAPVISLPVPHVAEIPASTIDVWNERGKLGAPCWELCLGDWFPR